MRDLETFWPVGSRRIRFLCNRGANGIDGFISSGLGAAAVSEHPLVIVTGDLAFYHDLNGLLAAKRHGLRATIIVINNDGGGIFSFLPQGACGDQVAEYFFTPHGLDFRGAAEMYGCVFTRVASWEQFRSAVAASLHAQQTTVIEVPSDRRAQRGVAPAHLGGRRRGCARGVKLMPDVRVGDVSLHVAVVGEGEPLMLLHGFTGSGAQWAPQVEAFAGKLPHHCGRSAGARPLGRAGRSGALPHGALCGGSSHAARRARGRACVLARILDGSAGGAWLSRWRIPGACARWCSKASHQASRIRSCVASASRTMKRSPTASSATASSVSSMTGCSSRCSLRRHASERRFSLRRARPAAPTAAVGLANTLRGMGTGAQEPLWDQLSTLAPPTLLVVGEEDMKFRAIAETMALRMPRATDGDHPAGRTCSPPGEREQRSTPACSGS